MFKNTDNRKFLYRSVLFLFCSFFFVSKSSGQEELLKAIENDDIATFDSILASGFNVNKRKTVIKTRYSISRKRRGRNGKMYIDKRARRGMPLIFIKRTDLPLTEAVFNHNYYFAEQLLKHGADPNKKKNAVLPPLAWAAHNGDADLVKLLLDHGADINGSEKNWKTTPLIEAIEWKRWGIAEYLIEQGADINIEDKDGNTALSHAATHKHEELVKILVEKGADVNHKNKRDEYVLEAACSDYKLFAETETSQSIIKYLVEHGASVNNDAILIVLRKGEAETAKYLLSRGAPVSNRLVHSASNGKNFELFRYLIDTLHLDINYYDKEGYFGGRALHGVCSGYWAERGSARIVNIPMLQYMLDKGVSLNDTNNTGQTALITLLEYGKIDQDTKIAAELLINKGADVNIAGGNMKFSPLMHAATDKLVETAKLLIKNGANVNYKDHEGRPILHWASWTRNNEEMIKLLVQSGADINAKNGRGETAAMNCVVFGSNENILAMIELGADLTIKDKIGYTLLDHVSDEKIIELLKRKGAKSGKDLN